MDPSVQRLTMRYCRKVLAARTKGFEPTLARTRRVLDRIKEWGEQFPALLRQSEAESEDAPNGWLWQTLFIDYFQGYDVYQSQLRDLDYTMEGLALSSDPFAEQAAEAREATKGPTRTARPSHAISDINFAFDPATETDEMLYKSATLKDWHRAFMRWVARSEALLDRLARAT